MHLELVDLLQCPVAHERSVLVAVTNEVESRYIVNGELGCHVCGATYPIANGVTRFATHAGVPQHAGDAPPAQRTNEGAAMALAAGLSLREGTDVFALVGYTATVVAALRTIVPARLLLVNPPGIATVFTALQASLGLAPLGIISAESLPLAGGRLAGAALATVGDVNGIGGVALAAALRAHGRLVAPLAEPVPDVTRELVRDEHVWVAEREPEASAPVQLRRG